VDSETNLRDILDKVDEISIDHVDDTHFFPLSQVYEDLLLKMGEKNSDGGHPRCRKLLLVDRGLRRLRISNRIGDDEWRRVRISENCSAIAIATGFVIRKAALDLRIIPSKFVVYAAFDEDRLRAPRALYPGGAPR
jgi:hypothetical protein